jgi:signal transduction histidine kinase
MLIRNKLILRFTGLALLIQVGLSGFVYWFSGVAREQRFTDRLAGEASLAARLLVREHHLDRQYLRTFHPREVPNLVGEEISLFDAASGGLLYANTSPNAPANHWKFFEQFQKESNTTSRRFVEGARETVALPYFDTRSARAYVLVAGGYDQDGFRQLRRLGRGLLVGNVGALVLIVLAGWHFADEALRPIARMVQQVRRIKAERLSERLDEGNQTDEIAQLAGTFNRLLTRLEAAFASQRAFVANASHELRTPLTIMRGTLETAVTYDQTLPDARASMKQAMIEIQKLIDLTNSLLTLARAEGSTSLQNASIVRLDECLLEALAEAHRRHPTLRVGLTLNDPPAHFFSETEPYSVYGFTTLLQTALVNLLDNAGKYGAPPVSVTLSYTDELKSVEITIGDQGTGFVPEDLLHAFEPLFRGEKTRDRPGFGLGLPIVQKVATLHGGSVTLTSDAAGTLATLRLPAA